MPRNSCTYKLGTPVTFRTASSAILDKYGTNLQNIEKEMRGIYHADPDKKLTQVDGEGADALIVAYSAEAGNYRALFQNKIKPHVYVALHTEEFQKVWRDIYGDIDRFILAEIPVLKTIDGWKDLESLIKSSDDWSKERRYYYIAKKVGHSANYDIKAPTLQITMLKETKGQLVLTQPAANRYLQAYRQLFPEIPRWQRSVIAEVEKSGYVRNLYNYPRWFGHYVPESQRKELYAHGPQSTVAILCHRTASRMQSFIRENDLDWDVLTTTHDSVLCQAPDSEVDTCGNKCREFMGEVLTGKDGTKFSMGADMKIGKNWGPKTKENPEGLE